MPFMSKGESIMNPLTAEQRENVANILRHAREAMNDSGAHWTQGTFEKYLNDDTGERAFCSIGAVDHITNQGVRPYATDEEWEMASEIKSAVIFALAEDEMLAGIDLSDLEKADYYGGEVEKERYLNEVRVIRFNDKNDTTWEDVEALFKRAEERVRSWEVAS
jgi:hypothetical protein